MSLMPSCVDMSRILSEARDSGRPLGAHARLHLWVCEVCRRLRVQFDVLARAARSAPEAGPGLTEQAKERLRRSLEPPTL